MSLPNNMKSVQPEAYALPRGGTEKDRLQNQHPLFEDFAGGLIHKFIPKSNIRTVADVATGSGIWLVNVAELLSNPANVYCGFDISTLQFPDRFDSQVGRFTLMEHDIRAPFPERYHGQFDLVKVRLVVQALRTEGKTAVTNVAELLRPSGHLQWQDLEWRDITTYPPHPYVDGINSIMRQHMKAHGLSKCLPVLVETSMKKVGLAEVNTEKSWHDASPARAAGATTATTAAMKCMLLKAIQTNMSMEDSSVDEARIQQVLEQLKLKLESFAGNGHNWKLSATIVVGRKG